MRTLILLSLLALAISPVAAQAPEPFERGMIAFGFSLGAGWGADVSLGKHSFLEDRHVKGWDVIGSLWRPYWGTHEPVGTGVDNPFDWWNKTGTSEKIAGFGIGARFFLGPIGLGALIDYVRKERFQNWISTASYTTWHTSLPEETSLSVTGHMAFIVSPTWSLTLYAGVERGVMGGAQFLF